METENVQDLPEMKPFSQIPEWKADDSFVLKGNEFEAIYNMLNIFMPSVNALQAAFERAVQAGTVVVKHEYNDGSGEVAKEDLDKYFAKVQELMKQQINK